MQAWRSGPVHGMRCTALRMQHSMPQQQQAQWGPVVPCLLVVGVQADGGLRGWCADRCGQCCPKQGHFTPASCCHGLLAVSLAIACGAACGWRGWGALNGSSILRPASTTWQEAGMLQLLLLCVLVLLLQQAAGPVRQQHGCECGPLARHCDLALPKCYRYTIWQHSNAREARCCCPGCSLALQAAAASL